MINKLTKKELADALRKNLTECSENEIRFAFHVFGLTLKECYFSGENGMSFEIHFRQSFIVRLIAAHKTGVLSFENEYIDFGEGTHGIAMGKIETLAETIVVFINMFGPNLLQSVGYNISFNEEMSLFNSVEEAEEYLIAAKDEAQKIIKVNHPDPVPAPGIKKKKRK